MDKSVTAILIRAEEWRDYDYSVTLFSAEGLIKAVMRGVRKKDAKLKFAAQPFALCSYELSCKNGNTVTGAVQVEDLSHLAVNIESFTAGCLMLECVEKSATAIDNTLLFVSLLKCLRAVLSGSCDVRMVTVKFLQKLLHESGFYKVEAKKCDVVTATDLLANIAASYLDGLSEIRCDQSLIHAALLRAVSAFERVFECTLVSAKGFKPNKQR